MRIGKQLLVTAAGVLIVIDSGAGTTGPSSGTAAGTLVSQAIGKDVAIREVVIQAIDTKRKRIRINGRIYQVTDNTAFYLGNRKIDGLGEIPVGSEANFVEANEPSTPTALRALYVKVMGEADRGAGRR